jgi:uncharacterized protein (DUF433 family)
MTGEKLYVRTDVNGAMRVGSSRVSLDSVVVGFLQGDAPETIQRNYPTLNLEDVYGAITYYLANRQEVDAYLRRQEDLWERAVAEQDRNPSPAMRRLRALKSIPEFEAAMDPLLTGEAREEAIGRLLAEVPNRMADGSLTPEQAAALEEWNRIRNRFRRDEQVESLETHLRAQLASGNISAEAKAAINTAIDAIRRSGDPRVGSAAEVSG